MRLRMHALSVVPVLIPAAASAQCEWETVSTPNPSDVINVFTASESDGANLHALLIEDDSFDWDNPVVPHVLRREGGLWSDLGGPGPGDLDGTPVYSALHADGSGAIWLGGVSERDRAYQAEPVVARYDGGWSDPREIDMVNQPHYPFHERGGEIYAMDTAPDGTVFAVGLAKNYGTTNDHSVPLFLVNSGRGWREMTRQETDWPGAFASDTYLTDVIAFASDNVWAVGRHAEEDGSHPVGGLIVHWDGSMLTIHEDPRTSGEFLGHPFEAMAANGPDDIWAVGGYVFSPRTSTIAHYDGAEWRRVESPVSDPLGTIALDDDGEAWAAGSGLGSDVAHFDGSAWSAEPAGRSDASVVTMAVEPSGEFWMLGADRAARSLAMQLKCACPADINGDGEVTTQDVLLFLNLFADGDPEADFDGDGEVTTQDVLAFLNAFVAGCP